MSLSGTFFCVTQVTESFPRMAMLVNPADLAALKAYSVRGTRNRGFEYGGIVIKAGSGEDRDFYLPTWYKRPSGLKMVMCLSYPFDILLHYFLHNF